MAHGTATNSILDEAADIYKSSGMIEFMDIWNA